MYLEQALDASPSGFAARTAEWKAQGIFAATKQCKIVVHRMSPAEVSAWSNDTLAPRPFVEIYRTDPADHCLAIFKDDVPPQSTRHAPDHSGIVRRASGGYVLIPMRFIPLCNNLLEWGAISPLNDDWSPITS